MEEFISALMEEIEGEEEVKVGGEILGEEGGILTELGVGRNEEELVGITIEGEEEEDKVGEDILGEEGGIFTGLGVEGNEEELVGIVIEEVGLGVR